MQRIGSRAEVFHGNAIQTSGGLKKKDLFKDSHGSIKSKKASKRAKKNKNLGKLLKQKGSGCFEYTKKVKQQVGGGKNKKDLELEKTIYIFSDDLPLYSLPEKYKKSKLKYKCNCPFSHFIKHDIADHIENPKNIISPDHTCGFAINEKNDFTKKELQSCCGCGCGEKHKLKKHVKKSQKGGGKFGAFFKKMGSAMKKAASKGMNLAKKGFQKAKAIGQKGFQKAKAMGQKMKAQAQQYGQAQAAQMPAMPQQMPQMPAMPQQMPQQMPQMPAMPQQMPQMPQGMPQQMPQITPQMAQMAQQMAPQQMAGKRKKKSKKKKNKSKKKKN